MYEKVLKNRKPQGYDWKFALIIAGTVLFLFVILAPIVYFTNFSGRYNDFKEHLNSSFLYAERQNSLTVTENGIEKEKPFYSAERLHLIIVDLGMGKKQDFSSVPESGKYISLSFGDGTDLTFYPVSVKTEDKTMADGVLFEYTGKDGYSYIYDTDKISYERLTRYFG